MKRVPIDNLQVDKGIIDFIKNQKDITIDKYSTKGSNSREKEGSDTVLKVNPNSP